ncbi:MAG: YaaL family protein [Firmicutes bacterium]|nr:YaaL family protein [Bacillota bacterium]
MNKRLARVISALRLPVRNEGEPTDSETRWPSLADAVEKARREWLLAKSYFNSVTDPDLVDHAIYAARAAEKKYIYLLKKARQEDSSLPHRERVLPQNGDRRAEDFKATS